MDLAKIRLDFPILSRTQGGRPYVYFDNGATAQKPWRVIKAIENYYTNQNSNIHRGVHALSREVTIAYEEARKTVQRHLGAASDKEIVFTRGTTESINLVAHCLGAIGLSEGDEIIITEMEHHSNILPWQALCCAKKAVLKYIPLERDGTLNLEALSVLITSKTKLISFSHVSNTLGTINDAKSICQIANEKGIPVFVDGAQAVPHMKPDVAALGCDFYTFSGHKLFGPTGIGVLYAKKKWLDEFPPYQLGGGIVKVVTMQSCELVEAPLKFEAGTPNIEGAIGLAEAIKYLDSVGWDNIARQEHELLTFMSDEIKKVPGVTVYGEAKNKVPVISFNLGSNHPFDVGTILDNYAIAVRTGHHCTQPIMQYYKIPGTVRASLAFYNSKEEVALFIEALHKSSKMLS
jgi:cysteine desulfurase/selenocysteine lyase